MTESAPDTRPVVYVSVDVETSGPSPSRYALLAIGACLVDDPEQAFYVELRPDADGADESAMKVSGLSLERLAAEGTDPAEAMRRFADWLAGAVPAGHRPLLVGFNAPFDWMFVADYFHRYLGRNPFGHTALDIKAYYAGLTGAPWGETGMRVVGERYLHRRELTHNALADARDQAELFRAILAEANRES